MKNKVILSILLLSSFASTNISLCGNWFTPPTPTEQFFKTIKKFAKKDFKYIKGAANSEFITKLLSITAYAAATKVSVDLIQEPCKFIFNHTYNFLNNSLSRIGKGIKRVFVKTEPAKTITTTIQIPTDNLSEEDINDIKNELISVKNSTEQNINADIQRIIQRKQLIKKIETDAIKRYLENEKKQKEVNKQKEVSK